MLTAIKVGLSPFFIHFMLNQVICSFVTLNLVIHLKRNRRDFNNSIRMETTTKLFSEIGQQQVIVNIVEHNYGIHS